MMSDMQSLITPEIALLFTRFVLGAVMVVYGWPKVRNLRANARDFDSMGIPPGWLFGTVIAFLEFFGGLFLIAGVATGLVAALFGFQMLLGTFWKIKIGKAFGDWSYDIILLALALIIMVNGGGAYSKVCTLTWFLRWDVAVGAIMLAIVWAWASRPTMKK